MEDSNIGTHHELPSKWHQTFYTLWLGCFVTGMGYSMTMPFISLLTSILIGWVIGPDWIIGEVERNGEHFKRAGLYRFMIRYVVPVVMLILFLVSTGFADLIS